MTITQMVDVPADRRLHLDFEFPFEIPAGKARVEVKVMPVVEKLTDRGTETALKSAGEGASPHPNSDALFALLAPLRGTVDVDKIRDERLAKHL